MPAWTVSLLNSYVYVSIFILQPYTSSQEGSKHMHIFKSFWGLVSLKSSSVCKNILLHWDQKKPFSLLFSCDSLWIVQLFLRDCSHISSKKGESNTRTWHSPIKSSKSMIYKCIHLHEIRVCPEFSFYVKALGHQNAMQSHRLRITTKMKAWGWKKD